MESPKKGRYKKVRNCKKCGATLKSVNSKDLFKEVICKICNTRH